MNRKRTAPTKTELLQLQKLYKTDEKIGERLGGVPAYLVAYWRRKKNIPKHSLPKFSEAEVRNLWERYGDDEKAGLELGLSKAAFYNWRRRYGIREKPAFLKLEQLELDFPGVKTGTHAISLYGKQTIAQKIIARLIDRERVDVGEQIAVEPDLVVSDGNLSKLAQQFRESGADYFWNPNKIAVDLDQVCPEHMPSEQVQSPSLREFFRRQRVKQLYDTRDGLCHQVVIERGLALPGQLLVGSDTQAVIFGAIGAMGTGCSSAQMPRLWAHGHLNLIVPDSARVSISGRRGKAIAARDIMLALQRELPENGLPEKAIEFGGSVITQMTQSERMAVASLSSELGVVGALLPYDATTRRYLAGRHTSTYKPVIPDKNAEYSDIVQVNIDHLTPMILCPSRPDRIKAVAELEGTAVQTIIVGSLAAGRYDDLRVIADILKGKQVHSDCRLLVMPASRSVYLEALNKGLVRVLLEAGAVITPSGHSSLLPFVGSLERGERCLAATDAKVSLLRHLPHNELFYCSPATAAASALHAAITEPTRYVR